MDDTTVDDTYAASETDMALSFEEGLEEIDSFFSSPGETDLNNNGTPHPVEASEPAVIENTGSQIPAHQVQNEFESANDDAARTVRAASHEQHESRDEFATLMEDMEDIGDVLHTSDDIADSNLKGQLHYILNSDSAPHPGDKAQTTTATTHQATPIPTVMQAAAKEFYDVTKSVKEPSQQHDSDAVASDQIEHATAQTELQPIDTDDGPPNLLTRPYSGSLPLSSLQAEKELPVLSPPCNLPLASPSTADDESRQAEPEHTLDQPTSSQESESLVLLSPKHSKSLDPSPMRNVSMTLQTSPTVPSSTGKSSLMDEMRNEEEVSGPDIDIAIAAPNFANELERAPVSERRDSVVVEDATTDTDHDLNELPETAAIDSPMALSEEPKAAGMVEVTDDPIEEKVEEDIPDKARSMANDESDTEMSDIPTTVEEVPPENEPVTEKTFKRAVPARKPDSALRAEKKARSVKTKTLPQPRRIPTRQQQAKQKQPAAVKAARDHATSKTASPQVVVPSKRKRAITTPEPESKKHKAMKKAGTTSQSHSEVGDATQPPAEAEPTTPRQRQTTNTITQREMKSMLWGAVSPHISPGPRKTRAQRIEEAKKVPNAGRAAKERHKQKGA